MEEENIKQLYDLLDSMPKSKQNKKKIEQIKNLLEEKDYAGALEVIESLNSDEEEQVEKTTKKTTRKKQVVEESDDETNTYPEKLSNVDLEKIYIGLLLNDPKLIVRYYFVYDECYFEDEEMLNLYKSVLFTEGAAYSS